MSHKRGRILAVCRSIEDISAFAHRIDDRQYIVATDDPEVETAATQLPHVFRVVPLEGSRSISEVWEDVATLTERVNRRLLAQQKHSHPVIVRWLAWPRASSTTARIVEAVLQVEAFERAMAGEVEAVLLIRRAAHRAADDLLVAVAESAGKEVIEVRRASWRIAKWLGLENDFLRVFGHRLPVILPRRLVLMGRRYRLVADVLGAMLAHPFVRRGDKARNVVLLHSGDHATPAEDPIPEQEEFERREAWRPLTLCWRAGNMYRSLRHLDLAAARLESWVPFGKLFRIARDYRLARKSIHAATHAFAGDEFRHGKVDLAPVLKELVEHFVRYELLERVMLFHALAHFLEVNHTEIVRTSDHGMSPLGAICHYLLTQTAVRTGKRRPFTYYHADTPLERYLPIRTDSACDLLLVAGEHDRQMTAVRGGACDHMVIGGSPLPAQVSRFAAAVCPADSAATLGIRRADLCNILFVSPGISSGYYSRQEFLRTATYLARFARQHSDTTLLVQPGSREERAEWERIVLRFAAPPNLHLAEESIASQHCVNFCDLLITKVARPAFEAMEFGRPVVAVSLDNDKRTLDTFGDAVLRFSDIEDLDGFLQYVLSDPRHLDVWRDTAVQKQNEFLREKIHRTDVPAEQFAVDRVIELLGNEMTLRRTIRRRVPNAPRHTATAVSA